MPYWFATDIRLTKRNLFLHAYINQRHPSCYNTEANIGGYIEYLFVGFLNADGAKLYCSCPFKCNLRVYKPYHSNNDKQYSKDETNIILLSSCHYLTLKRFSTIAKG